MPRVAWIKQENKEGWDIAVKNHNERNRVQQREEGDKNVLENQSKKPEGDKKLLSKLREIQVRQRTMEQMGN